MYPFPDTPPFVRNQWYVAAQGDEISRTLMERTLLGEPVVLYRTEAGEPVAMHGICPHRMLPLIQGKLVGDTVECGYHGFAFDCDGKCVRIPTQSKVPASFRTRTYPMVERGPWVWIWMGDPDSADPSLVPDTESIGIAADGWTACSLAHVHLAARAQLLIDNLLDLTHIGWVHAASIGQTDMVFSEPDIEDCDGRYIVRRVQRNVELDGFHRYLFPHIQERIDTALYTEVMNLGLYNACGPDVYLAATGEPVGRVNFVHAATPETAYSTHYFGVVTRNFRLEDTALSDALAAQDQRVRSEDKATLEAIEPIADRYGDPRHELSALADGGALRLRRRIFELLEAERPRS